VWPMPFMARLVHQFLWSITESFCCLDIRNLIGGDLNDLSILNNDSGYSKLSV